MFQTVFVSGAFRAASSLCGEQKALTKEQRERAREKKVNDPDHRVTVYGLMLTAVVITTNKAAGICLNILPGEVEKVCHASYIVIFFCCFILQ